MAEALTVVGAVASIVQLVDFTTKVFERVSHYLRRVDEAPEALRDIGIHLPLFIDALRRIQFHIDFGHFNPQSSSALKILMDECSSQMNALDNLMTKLTPEQGDSKLTKTRKAILSLKDEKTLERIFSKISDYVKMLLLYQNSVTSIHTMANTKLVLKQIEKASLLETTAKIDSVTTGALVIDSQSVSAESSTPQAASKSLANYFKRNKQRRISYFMGLARFGLLWAFQADLDLSWGNYGFSISPSIHFQQLVKNTSPGFKLVFKCYEEQLDIQTSCGDLLRLFQTGTISPWDIFPDGTTWLERLLKNLIYSPELVLGFVRILCKCSAPIRTQKSLLSFVASWNSRGIHLELLKELLASGYDCSKDTTYTDLLDPWMDQDAPKPHGFCFYKIEYGECEPFLLKFLVECSKNAYGVWGQTPLMDSILCGSNFEISKLLEHPQCLRGNNCLGQTAAHVAVLRPDVLSMLLKAYSTFDVADIDATDLYGNSPLVYAAAYGQTDSVIHLLKAGADPLKDGHLEFLQRALLWKHWEVANEAFAFWRKTAHYSSAFLQSEIHHIMAKVPALAHIPWWWQVYWSRSSEFLGKMFNLGVDKHVIFEDGNTLLHLAQDSKGIDCLFNAGFQKIDHRNNEGETALMAFIPGRSGLARHVLTRGCNANYRNNRGETALQKACTEGYLYWIPCSSHGATVALHSHSLESLSSDLAAIANLLHHGADTSIHDDCRCPCAPNGCHPLRQLLHPRGQSIGHIWIMECLLMLIDIQGRKIAQKALFDIKRVHQFELADMTHVCCSRETNHAHESMDDAEVDEIIEEEKEFVAILEEKMRDTSSGADNKSIEESWLSLILDFRTPDKPFKREKYWISWGSGAGHDHERIPLTSDTLISRDTTSLGVSRAEEERDRYWILAEATGGHVMPQSSVYSAWVDWVYKNPDRYDYPLPVDRDWYERRKYWATRQAEVLEGMS